ncbi:MFS transporter [Streptomyces sp. NPDC090442]|uniref:MFS transporter n=1 Tax=Streptomyces sp. NPDC090442 TaxID=3365962 RepID=UPI00380AA96D
MSGASVGESVRSVERRGSAGRRWWAFAGLSLISFLGCIDLTIVNTAAPAIQRDMGATVTELQLIVNVFIVALSMFMVTMGRLADSHGRRRVLYTGTAVFGLASLAAGCAADVRMLIVCRFVQGAACAVLYTSTGALVSDTFPPERRGRAIGALYGVNGLGLAIGPMLGGFIVGQLSWRWVFWINVPLTAVGLAVCCFSIRVSGQRVAGTGKPDRPGLVLISIALPAVVLGLTLGDAWGWTSVRVLGLLAVGIVGVLAFCVVERKVAAPLVDFQLFGNRTFLGALTADFSLAFFYCLAFFLMPLYLVSVRHDGGTASGLMLLPCTAVMAVLSPVVGRLVDRFPPRLLLCGGFVAFALSAALQAQFSTESGVVLVMAAFALMGIGWALVLGPATRRRAVRRAGAAGGDRGGFVVDLPQPGRGDRAGGRDGGLPLVGAGRVGRGAGRAPAAGRGVGVAGGGRPGSGEGAVARAHRAGRARRRGALRGVVRPGEPGGDVAAVRGGRRRVPGDLGRDAGAWWDVGWGGRGGRGG